MKLAGPARGQLRDTFLAAFGDYAIDVGRVDERWLHVRMTKNAVDFEASVGAFDGERMVGFTLIGIGQCRGELTAYDAATGIVPGYRGRGLAREMFDHALPALRERGVTRFRLEVLQVNAPAIRAYRRAGFEVDRELRCFEIDVGAVAVEAPDGGSSIRPVDRAVVPGFREHLDWPPSWENDLPAIERIPDDLVCFGAFDRDECVGVIVYAPVLNWVMLLAVKRGRRRRGVASSLVRHLATCLPEVVPALRFNNVDASDAGMLALAGRLGFRPTVDQFEMSLGL